jgi:hypothetical protein
MQWNKTYDSPIVKENGYRSSCYGYSVVQTGDGGYAIAGNAGGSDSYTYTEVSLVKADSDGNVQWIKTSRGKANVNYRGYSVIQASDGGYAIAGSAGDSMDMDVYFVKMASDNPIPILSREPASDVQANQPVKISAGVVYTTSQIENVTLFYLLNDTAIWEGRVKMSLNTSTNLYEASIPGQTSGTAVQFRVVAYDIDGMSAAREASYTVSQAVPPTVHVISPENKTYSESEVPLTFTLDKPVVWIGYSLDGHETLTITGNSTIVGLANGLHNITVYAKDAFENVGTSETITFTVVTTTFPPIWILVLAISVIVVGIGLLVHFKKRNR